MLSESKGSGTESPCEDATNMFFFMTDGEPTEGLRSPNELSTLISSQN